MVSIKMHPKTSTRGAGLVTNIAKVTRRLDMLRLDVFKNVKAAS